MWWKKTQVIIWLYIGQTGSTHMYQAFHYSSHYIQERIFNGPQAAVPFRTEILSTVMKI